MKQEEISLKQNETIAFHHRLICGMFLLMILMSISKVSNTFILMSFLGVFAMYFVDILAYNANYYNKKRLVCIIRALQMLSASVFIMATGGTLFVQLTGFALYIAYFIEYVESMQEKSEKAQKAAVAIFVVLFSIAALIGIFRVAAYKKPFVAMFSVAITVGIMLCLSKRNLQKKYEEEQNVEKLHYEIGELQKEHEEMQKNQDKIKRAIELLGIQKCELANANKMIKKQNDEMILQNNMLKCISNNREVSDLLDQLTDIILKKDGIEAGGILVSREVYLNRNSVYSFKVRENAQMERILEDSCGQLLTKAEQMEEDSFICSNIDESEFFYLSCKQIESFLLIPIIIDTKVCGYLFFGSSKADIFDGDLKFYYSVASQISIALYNARLYAKMEDMAIKDGLTGIFNRRYFTKMFYDAVETAVQEKMCLSVALFDIDKFKKVNDTYGHTFGDEVIKCVSRLGNEIASENGGFIGRYGGEEFVVVFLGKNVEQTYELMTQLQNKIKKAVLIHEGVKVPVNVSIGITEYPSLCKDTKDLLNHADSSMYYSKLNGRGKIVIDSEEVLAASI